MYILRYRSIGGRTFCIVSCGIVRCSSAFFANEKKRRGSILLFCFVFLIYIFPCVRWLYKGVGIANGRKEGRKTCGVKKEAP